MKSLFFARLEFLQLGFAVYISKEGKTAEGHEKSPRGMQQQQYRWFFDLEKPIQLYLLSGQVRRGGLEIC